MITTSKFIMSGCSSRCAFCNRPFCSRDGYVEFWRASNGEHFCSEFCAGGFVLWTDFRHNRLFGCDLRERYSASSGMFGQGWGNP
jgi:hypothetical protein